ncbi:MAG: hybrid sensor histidine kinase/response regulator [Bacteroidota bacterium]|nr:hybrid sensor histidine kinase/response regulator [Bacteroidota bacterium]
MKHYSEKQPLILLVDDIVENLKVLGNIFKNEGFQIAIASNGEAAISIAHSRLPDLILLDVQMPGMDGFEVCKALKNDLLTKDIPILFLTAKTENEDIIRGFELGAVDYVTKPFNNNELLARVHTHIELQLTKKKLVASNHELEGLVATKDKFFSIIAHDLRTPFIALLGFSEIIKDDFKELSESSLLEYINIIHITANDTYKLLDNLLQWSRMQLGKIDFVPKSFNLYQSINQICNFLKLQASQKNVTLDNRAPEQAVVYADNNMLDTIIRNIISNAIKFSNSGSSITIGFDDTELKESVIYIKDQGQGIPYEAQDKLFKLDVNYSTLGTNKEKGTGLGLILCKEMVEKHNGKIWFKSIPDEGTTFFISLPKNVQ